MKTRGVRAKVFTADIQVEREPTLLYGILITPSTAATLGIVRCYDGEGTDGEKIAEFCSSYGDATPLLAPIQFKRGLYVDVVSGVASITVSWLTNEVTDKLQQEG